MIEWADVLNYEGVYKVSKCGLIKSLDHNVYNKDGVFVRIQKGRILKQYECVKGYLRVSLSKKGVKFTTGIHRLVLSSFKGLDECENKNQVNHIDGDKKNNNINNLEWVTNQENQIHAVDNKLIKHNLADKHHMSKLSNNEVKKARQMHYKHGCNNITLASMFNISASAMSNILRNKTYINI